MMKSQEEMESYDYLTGLPMRNRGETAIAHQMQQRAGCLVFLDMDNLKKINDIYGHKAGDRTLKLLGNLLKKEETKESYKSLYTTADILEFVSYIKRLKINIDKLEKIKLFEDD